MKRLLLISAVLVCQAFANISIVGTPTSNQVNPSGGLPTTLSCPATTYTAGNALAVWVTGAETIGVAAPGPTNPFTGGVTDTAGNTFTAGTYRNKTGIDGGVWYYALSISGSLTNDVITLHNASAGGDSVSLSCYQLAGVKTTAALDQDCGGIGGASAALASAACTTTQANEILLVGGVGHVTGTTYTASSGYTVQTTVSDGTSVTEDQIVSSIQTSVTPGFTASNGVW